MTAKKCACVYATSANTESVRLGYEMGGYLKEECLPCRLRATAHLPSSVRKLLKEKTAMRKVAHYYYPGQEVVISCGDRRVTVRDEKGALMYDPCHKKAHPHPVEGDFDPGIPTYEEIGLYYEYEMPGTGWGGDC